MSERDRRKEKEDGRRTLFGRQEVWRDQTMPEARLWLRDYLGRQASSRSGTTDKGGLGKDSGKEREREKESV